MVEVVGKVESVADPEDPDPLDEDNNLAQVVLSWKLTSSASAPRRIVMALDPFDAGRNSYEAIIPGQVTLSASGMASSHHGRMKCRLSSMSTPYLQGDEQEQQPAGDLEGLERDAQGVEHLLAEQGEADDDAEGDRRTDQGGPVALTGSFTQ